jgi:sortase (surface protein transpeptidase)
MASIVTLLAGCGSSEGAAPKATTTTTEAPPPETTTTATTAPRWEVDAPEPARVRIPAIDVDADVIDLWLNDDGSLQTPDDDFSQAGWYTGRSAPGEQGPLIVVGHVDNKSGPAVFFRLKELAPGDEVEMVRDDGSSVFYVVESSERVPKDSFPTEKVYGPTDVPTLRLVTCGGSFDRSTGHYIDNIITYATIRDA